MTENLFGLPPFQMESSSDVLKTYFHPEGILVVELNRPEVKNAFNGELIQELIAVLEETEQRQDIKVLVLSGKGDAFCAGGDLNYMKSIGSNSFEENKEDALQMAYLMQCLHEYPKPTIARVQGAAFGGGVGLLCCCDMAFGSEKTQICLSEVRIGMIAATIGPYALKAIGPRNAHRYMLTAEVLKGEEAQTAGFLSGVYAHEELDEKILKLCLNLCKNAPNAVEISKALLQNIYNQPIEEGLIDYTAEVIATARASEEGKEGLSSFLEKRKPQWGNK